MSGLCIFIDRYFSSRVEVLQDFRSRGNGWEKYQEVQSGNSLPKNRGGRRHSTPYIAIRCAVLTLEYEITARKTPFRPPSLLLKYIKVETFARTSLIYFSIEILIYIYKVRILFGIKIYFEI